MTSKHTRLFGFGLCVALAASAVTAQDAVRITQKGKQFSEANVDLTPGQKVVFVNDDNVAHNVYAIVKGKKQDLGLQKPNEEGSIAFDAPGTYRVRCAIHPKMKMVVKVK